jgi:hypothetical protein
VCAALSHRCLAVFSFHRSLGNLAVNLALAGAVSAYLRRTSNCRRHNRRLASVGAAAEDIKTCGYHRRDEELAQLEAVLEAKRTFASLPPRV